MSCWPFIEVPLFNQTAAEVPLGEVRLVVCGLEIPCRNLQVFWRIEWPGVPFEERMLVMVPDPNQSATMFNQPTVEIEVHRAGVSADGTPVFWDGRAVGAIN